MDIGAMVDWKTKARKKERQRTARGYQKQGSQQQQQGNKGKQNNKGGKTNGEGDSKTNNEGREEKEHQRQKEQQTLCDKYGHVAADCWWKIGGVGGFVV